MFVPILTYHKIQEEFELGVSFITPKQFERQIEYLYRQGFKSVSIYDYVRGKTLPEKSVIITFDDAYESVFHNALPILRKFDFTASIFAITKFMGDANRWDYHFERFQFYHCSWEQIRYLAEIGWEVGSHTVNHANLRHLDERSIWHEVKYSKELIEHQLGSPVHIISYPYGWVNSKIVELVKSAGYEAGCTLGYNDAEKIESHFALARRGVYVFEPFTIFKNKLTNNFMSYCDDFKQQLFSSITQSVALFRAQRCK